MSLQTNPEGYTVLLVSDAAAALTFDNPLRDPVVLVKRDGKYALKDGFHRIHEACVRLCVAGVDGRVGHECGRRRRLTLHAKSLAKSRARSNLAYRF